MLVLSLKPGESIHFIQDSDPMKLTYTGLVKAIRSSPLNGLIEFRCSGVKTIELHGLPSAPCGRCQIAWTGIGSPIIIDDQITVTVLRCKKGNARIGIDAPREILILRDKHLTKECVK